MVNPTEVRQPTGRPQAATGGASRQFHTSVLIKPTSSRCNLDCSYCFYLAKAAMYPWGDHPTLSLDTFDKFLSQYVPMSAPYLTFMWQGGEPTMMGLPFFQDAYRLQKEHARRVNPVLTPPVTNSIQTNGTLLNDDWAKFFKESDFLVGISLDGPPDMHDQFRRDRTARPTFDRVMNGIEVLRKHDVPFNILCVVNRVNVEQPRELFAWLVAQEFTDIQFIPCVEPAEGAHSAEEGITDESITPEQFGEFLCQVFDAWVETGIANVRLRWYDNIIQRLWGFPSEMCTMSPACGYLVLEHNGDCYPCDFFVQDDQLLGNIHNTPLREMVGGRSFIEFGQTKAKLHDECARCPWLSLCYGECPRYRITASGSAEHTLPYFCESYKRMFSEKYPELERLSIESGRTLGLAVQQRAIPADERTAKRTPSFEQVLEVAKRSRTGRNDACPCGSGRKFKRCCQRQV
ncbi:MAG: anaerobic sulfatase maturase [SAR202 cluster bacterium]|nr:anaerobic sulfatase maturase [SAR202 cluster bacterium]MDP6713454.1 anaerobic sulfatase maturase [SAR202 cluster bacterium]